MWFRKGIGNGNITTTITGSSTSTAVTGDSRDNPFIIGTKSENFDYTDTQNTTNFTNNNERSPNDVYYQFTISKSMSVIISHCGSELNDTYLHLLNSSGVVIASNDDYYGENKCTNSYHSYIRQLLAPGTYYVISEGYSGNGSITTSIKGLLPLGGLEVSTGQNYILSITPTVATTDVNYLPVEQCKQTVSYFDGLGRPLQTVLRGITPNKADLVSGIVYDNAGREAQKWLPAVVADNKGAYVSNYQNYAISSNYGDQYPYQQTNYEPSPLNRVTRQWGVGQDWRNAGRADSIVYLTNDGNDVNRYTVDDNTVAYNGAYDAGQLYVTETRDEENHITREYKDKQGQVVLKRVIPVENNRSLYHDTYYISDDFGNLRFVLPPKLEGSVDANLLNQYGYSSKGLLTGTKVAMLNNTSTQLITTIYYDDKARPVQTLATNNLSGYDYEYTAYNFTGQPIKKRHVHKAFNNAVITEDYVYTYDHAGRPLVTTHKLNGGTEVTLSSISYDEQGRVSNKSVHGGAHSTGYAYNVRSWVKSISSPEFSETLFYQDQLDGKPACYNGNISAMQWSTAYDGNSQRKYYYTYDALNRLTKATYSPNEIYNEEVGLYDKNGNILQLKRNGYVYPNNINKIDDLELSYNGNQLTYVKDVSTETPKGFNDFKDKTDSSTPIEYKYDNNGNMRSDYNKGISWIKYNSLNLPAKLQFANGNKSEYLYDASGVKRQAKYSFSPIGVNIPIDDRYIENQQFDSLNVTDYCGNYIYEKGVLKRILTPEGYIAADNGYRYSYFLKDHLGDTRVNISVLVGSTSYSTDQTTHYYPFGLEFYAQSGIMSGANPYLYNGKEMDRMHGLNMLDYGARWYDGTVGRWGVVDPLAEKYYSISPYVYCDNNPVKFIDPDGMEINLSNMSDDEKEKYQTQIANQRKQSELFNTMYTTLENSKNVYNVRFGQTTKDAQGDPYDGQFDADKSGKGGGDVTFLEGQKIKSGALTEEFFHAYQSENKEGYDKGEFNIEFEAKVAVTAMGLQYGGFGEIPGATDFQGKLKMNDYGEGLMPITSKAVESKSFLDEYKSAANSYSKYNRDHNIGNSHYRINTTVTPFSLTKLIIDTYGK